MRRTRWNWDAMPIGKRLTTAEAAALVGIPLPTLRAYVAMGRSLPAEITVRRIGRRVRLTRRRGAAICQRIAAPY